MTSSFPTATEQIQVRFSIHRRNLPDLSNIRTSKFRKVNDLYTILTFLPYLFFIAGLYPQNIHLYPTMAEEG